MKAANAPKYLQAEQHAKDRLEPRGKPAKDRIDDEPKPPPLDEGRPVADVGLEATAADADPEPLSAEAGI